ncbi:MAG: hypothetical protein JW731_05300 [Bacteroidales bacterium]|nr:hypothetical protein [Bacteroidales bacterium]
MADKNVIETQGSITKKEILGTVEGDLTGGNLVLENKHPFPGYHGKSVPDFHELIPDSLFIITRQPYTEEDVIRISHKVRKVFKKRFDAAPGKITVFNEMNPCIRIKFLQKYRDIPELIDLFTNNGVQFAKYRRITDYVGIIKINKFFSLELLDPGIYLDSEDPDMCYLQLPMNLDWDTFERITLSMKRNMEDNKFDAAQAMIFRKNCIIDSVRIYDHHIHRDKINLIRDKYMAEVKKLNL